MSNHKKLRFESLTYERKKAVLAYTRELCRKFSTYPRVLPPIAEAKNISLIVIKKTND